MSTIDRVLGLKGATSATPLDAHGLSIGIVVAEWNSNVTESLLQGTIDTLRTAGAMRVDVLRVPGAYELTNGAARLLDSLLYDAIITIGCVVRGDTPHFDYVCQGVTYGTTLLNARKQPSNPRSSAPVPVIFCVLTTDTMEQALARAGGDLGNKGVEAAETAIQHLRARPIRVI